MFQAFVWMFRALNFKQHYWLIFSMVLITYIPILAPNNITKIISLIPLIYIFGYFWNLVENIIDKDVNIEANNVYDGKIKEIYNIILPSLGIKNNMWRGIAFVAALFLLLIPAGLIMYLGINACANPLIVKVFLALFILTVPAFLWNYADKNSIVSVWNIGKAVYIMGNYPFRYLSRFLVFAAIFLVSGFIDGFLLSYYPIFILICALKQTYVVYVYAYLMGTLMPHSEANIV